MGRRAHARARRIFCSGGYDWSVLGLTFDKLLVILVIAIFVVGPERLPGYAKKLGELVRGVKRMADGAKDRLRDEMGPEFDDVDWRQLDPRQYDPRRIIREALLEDDAPAAPVVTAAPPRESAYAQRQRKLREGQPAPFDAEAT